MFNTFAQKIFSFEDGSYFDQPSPVRLLGGLAKFVNEYAFRYAASAYLKFDMQNENLNILLNCKNVSDILKKPVKADEIELSGG